MATKAPHRKPRPGRPPKDPGDVRAIRFALRLHPDLYSEMVRLARLGGLTVSAFLEKAAIARVHSEVGQPVLDAIGRYRQNHPAEAG